MARIVLQPLLRCIFRKIMRKGFLRHLLLTITVAGIFICIGYFVMQSDFYVRSMNHPVINVSGADRGRCCVSIHHSLDICGRPDCLWNCPLFEPQFPLPRRDREKAFFHETSGVRALNFRQACSVESLAIMNPHLTVILLMSGKDIDWNSTTMKTLGNYENIKVYNINLGDYFIHSPFQQWYFCSTWNYGPFAVSHLSDALRFLTLYKYGGYYFDLDIIMVQPVTHYRNFIGAENEKNLAAGALHVDYLHPVIRMAVEEFRETYRKDIWGHNGPLLLTRVMTKWCLTENIAKMNSDSCYGFEILPPKTFYPIEWPKWLRYFLEQDITWENDTIGIHVWNQKSAGHAVSKSSEQVYTKLARSQCPSIFAMAPDVF